MNWIDAVLYFILGALAGVWMERRRARKAKVVISNTGDQVKAMIENLEIAILVDPKIREVLKKCL